MTDSLFQERVIGRFAPSNWAARRTQFNHLYFLSVGILEGYELDKILTVFESLENSKDLFRMRHGVFLWTNAIMLFVTFFAEQGYAYGREGVIWSRI